MEEVTFAEVKRKIVSKDAQRLYFAISIDVLPLFALQKYPSF